MDKLSQVDALERSIKHFLLQKDIKNVLLGISGGADSTALLLALHACKINVHCIHCNFHLRGEESQRDQQHVEQLCKRLNIPLEIFDFDVNKYREGKKISVEMACRELRYSLFHERISVGDFQRVAIAHNADDNIETLLLNLFRGTGIKGLRGMKSDTGSIIRPLLNISRKQIEEYVALKRETYVNDSTNFESDFKRNFIRNQLLPMIEERWEGVRASLKSVIENISVEEEALDYLEKGIIGETRNYLSWDTIQSEPGFKWIIGRFCIKLGVPRPIIKEVINVYASEGENAKGKKWFLENGKLIYGNGGLYFIKEEDTKRNRELDLQELFDIKEFNSEDISFEKMKSEGNKSLYLPFSPDNIRIRKFRSGDRIKPLGMKGSRLVSDIIRDAKLSPIEKENILVAENEKTGDIIWVDGLKRSRLDLVRPSDKRIFRITRKIL